MSPEQVAALREHLGARLIETHISWVLVTGRHAYKLKKPLDLGFLDFSTAPLRRRCCDEEVRLNRRLAPEYYLGVVPVVDTWRGPRIGEEGRVIDWAVHMRAFPPEATLDRAAQISPAQIDAIADTVAAFHGRIARAPAASPYGTPEHLLQPVAENFRQIRALQPDAEAIELLASIEAWSLAQAQRLDEHFVARKRTGWVRECHGDLHLGNIAWVEGRPLIFDCIEFNPALRYIDVTSEIAFLTMDLASRGHPSLAWRFLNRWLEHTGDHAGLAALVFYQVYRAMVRAKVDYIRAAQGDAAAGADARAYLRLAADLARPRRPALILMHGVTGSGKTTLSQQVLETLGAVRLRSDVERKRLFGLSPLEDSRRIPGGIYTEEANRRTFEHIEQTARTLLAAGFTVVADATFLRRAHREPLQKAAESAGAPWLILSLQTDEATLRGRVAQRAATRSDASEATLAVLEHQLAQREPLTAEELAHAMVFDGAQPDTWPPMLAQVVARLGL
ncbi:MAG: AAA family ATPase [Burkholderiales bacterium]|nr:AAA family ATPase [Burkholderiales bacterium]